MTEVNSRLASALSDRYQVERELGRGGTAIVYLALDLRHGRRVAVKVLYPELAASLGPERFLREVEISASLSHPHILPLYDSGEADGFLYYVMPYVEGESLRHRLRREIQMPVDEAVRIAREVAEALDYAHQRGIVHRDIKPENILLEGDHAVVADFGVARAIESASSDRLTDTGLAVGTAVYMSPEQAAATGRVDGRSDIYSLGCVLYEMLAGEPPFSGGTPQAIVAKHMQARIPPLRVVRPTVSKALQEVISKALAKVPADRYATGRELDRALLAAAQGASPASRPGLAKALLAALILGSVALVIRLSSSRPMALSDPALATSALDRPRIAVMYFDDVSSDSSLRHLADAVTEELIYELSGVGGLQVISRNGMQAYRGRDVRLDSMVAHLHLQLVVDGSIQRSRNGIRLRVHLIKAPTDTYVDSLSLDRAVFDTLAFARSAAQEIAAGLRRAMGREARLRDAGAGSRSPRAQELARKAQRAREDAREIAESPHPEDVGIALQALHRADSLLALAHTTDPEWYGSWVERGWIAADRAALSGDSLRIAALSDGLRFAEEAVRRAPDSADALELRGTLRGRLVGQMQVAAEAPRAREAEADLRAALDRDSTRVRAWATLGYILWSKGSITEAALASRRALREDTYLTEARGIYNELFFDDLMLGNFRQAEEWCRRGRAAYPMEWRFVECELTLMRHDPERTSDADSAWRVVRLLERLDPPERARSEGRTYHTIYRRIVAATVSARAGRLDVARAEIARARRITRADTTLSIDLDYDEAALRLALGERQRAAALLREYVAARPLARDQLARDPLLRELPIRR